MMTTVKSKRISALKYALIIPIAGVFASVTVNQPVKAQTNKAIAKSETDKVYEKVDMMPEFKGGMNGLMTFMGESINYPKGSKAEGKVLVSFIVDEKGNVTNAEVMKGVDIELDEEALRVVKSMPKWIPGKVGDKAVKVKMTLPIVFKLD